ncbi:hypothetical protein FBU31_001039 [Coemansia sp. 'formosensis']|nr:hypothetical protein FBU31_001039 [Coemansia sp. 'formosensis']
MSQAVQLLEAGYGLPGQQAHDEKIFSSLLMALSSQNVPSQATSIAGSLVSVLENNNTPQRLAALASSMVAELKNPSVNTQLASIVDELVTFVIQVHAEATRHADDTPVGPTPTTTSAPTSTSADATLKNSVSSDSPLSKSNAAHPMKPLFGYLSMGVAGVVTSFF